MSLSAKISYLEYPAQDLTKTKCFFESVFNWKFIDYGSEYIAFEESTGLKGGFYHSNLCSSTNNGAALTVFYSGNITEIQHKITESGGKIIKALFSFPGGVRFHFSDTNGNEFAVWSEKI